MQTISHLVSDLSPAIFGSHIGYVIANGSTLNPAIASISAVGIIFSELFSSEDHKSSLMKKVQLTAFSAFDMTTSIICSQIGYSLLIGSTATLTLPSSILTFCAVGLFMKYVLKDADEKSFILNESLKIAFSFGTGYLTGYLQSISHSFELQEAYNKLCFETRNNYVSEKIKSIVQDYNLPLGFSIIDQVKDIKMSWSYFEFHPSSLNKNIPGATFFSNQSIAEFGYYISCSDYVKPVFIKTAMEPFMDAATAATTFLTTLKNILILESLKEFLSSALDFLSEIIERVIMSIAAILGLFFISTLFLVISIHEMATKKY